MKIFFIILLALHGIIHLLGFLKAFSIAEIKDLTLPVTKIAGIFWLFSAVLFLVTLVFYLKQVEYWWILAILAIILSQILILISWKDAKFGTIANIMIILPVVVAFLNSLPSGFQNRFRHEVQMQIEPAGEEVILTDTAITGLPGPVKKYLRYVGAVGKPVVQNFRAAFTGSMKMKVDAKWIDIQSHQYNFYNSKSRIFYIHSKLYGIPFDGLHLYIGENATMQIKIASLIKVADAKGEKMFQGETVTLFNDMCLLAPSALIDKNIEWEEKDSLTVKARFTNSGCAITALLHFNKEGELINFVSDDRYYSTDGKVYHRYRWSTPVKRYIEKDGRKIPAYAEAIWHMPERDYVYAKFYTKEIEYNCREYKPLKN